MINALPIFGWLLSLFVQTSMAVPFWFCWTVCGLGQIYFYWLPTVYHNMPFWHCVGVFMILSILKAVLIPKLVNVEQKDIKSTTC